MFSVRSFTSISVSDKYLEFFMGDIGVSQRWLALLISVVTLAKFWSNAFMKRKMVSWSGYALVTKKLRRKCLVLESAAMLLTLPNLLSF